MPKGFALIALGLLLCPMTPPAIAAPRSDKFLDFWAEFRSAVLKDDKTKIVKLTHFPFETRGPMDDDPVTKHDKKWFLEAYNQLLNIDSGLSPEPVTMRKLIKDTSILTPTDGQARLGAFIFKYMDGKWLFAFAYLEE